MLVGSSLPQKSGEKLPTDSIHLAPGNAKMVSIVTFPHYRHLMEYADIWNFFRGSPSLWGISGGAQFPSRDGDLFQVIH